MSEIISAGSAGGLTLPLPRERSIMFSKDVDLLSIEELSRKILEINDNDRILEKLYPVYGLTYNAPPIKIFIDSYGGWVYQILGVISIIENSQTPVYTYCTGAAMSCGFMLLISGHKRFCYKYGTPMYHQVSSYSFGKVKQISEDLKETERLQARLEEITLRKTKITRKTLDKNYKRKVDWFMTAEEAKKFGVIDEII